MTLSITEILVNPVVRKAMEDVYSVEEINDLVKEQMTPAAIKKAIMESVKTLSEADNILVLIKASFLLLAEELDSAQLDDLNEITENLDSFLEAHFTTAKPVADNLSLLGDAELKNLLKSITKSEMFNTRKRKDTEEMDAEESTVDDCPLDSVSL